MAVYGNEKGEIVNDYKQDDGDKGGREEQVEVKRDKMKKKQEKFKMKKEDKNK